MRDKNRIAWNKSLEKADNGIADWNSLRQRILTEQTFPMPKVPENTTNLEGDSRMRIILK